MVRQSMICVRSSFISLGLLLHLLCRSRPDLSVSAFRPSYLTSPYISSRSSLIELGAKRKLFANINSRSDTTTITRSRRVGDNVGRPKDTACARGRCRGLFLTTANRRVSIIATASAILTIASTMVWPAPCHALDIAALTGDASTLLSQTVTWWSTVAETGFYQAFSLVFLSEIGDKTFFIAGLLAMKTTRLISFLGSMGALFAMTIVSVLIGQIFHAVPSGFLADGLPLDDIAAALAFAFFGIKTLKEALAADPSEGGSTMDEELAEAKEVVEKRRDGLDEGATPWGQIVSIFALVFAAEFGDRSFVSTIALSASQNPCVAGGAVAAHALATGIAVSGGSFVAKYISEKVIGIIGGSLFLVFAVTTALGIF